MRADLTAIQVKAIVAMLADQLGDEPDDQLLLDTLEGETDLFEITSRLVGKIEDEEGKVKILAEQIESRKLRSDRADQRAEHYRGTIQALMETAGIDKLPLPEATVTLRDLADKLVPQKGAVPDDFMKDGPKQIDAVAIKAKFEDSTDPLPNWLSRETGRRSLTIRRK